MDGPDRACEFTPEQCKRSLVKAQRAGKFRVWFVFLVMFALGSYSSTLYHEPQVEALKDHVNALRMQIDQCNLAAEAHTHDERSRESSHVPSQGGGAGGDGLQETATTADRVHALFLSMYLKDGGADGRFAELDGPYRQYEEPTVVDYLERVYKKRFPIPKEQWQVDLDRRSKDSTGVCLFNEHNGTKWGELSPSHPQCVKMRTDLGGDVQVENKILQAAGLFKYYFDGEADGFTQTIINRPRTAKVQRDAGTAEGGAEPSKPVVAILIGSTLKGVVGAYEGNGESCQFARDGSCDESKDNKDGLCAAGTDCTDCENCDGPEIAAKKILGSLTDTKRNFCGGVCRDSHAAQDEKDSCSKICDLLSSNQAKKGFCANVFADVALFSMVLPSVAETAEAAVEYWLYLAVDDDDPFYSDEFNRDELRQWFAAMWARTAGPSVVAKLAIVQLHNPVHRPGPAFNVAAASAYVDGADYFYRINDDTRLDGKWASTFIKYLAELNPPNVGVIGPVSIGSGNGIEGESIQRPDIMTHDFTHRTHLEVFDGLYYPAVLDSWWLDDWISWIYGPAKTCHAKTMQVRHKSFYGTRYTVQESSVCLVDYLIAKGLAATQARAATKRAPAGQLQVNDGRLLKKILGNG